MVAKEHQDKRIRTIQVMKILKFKRRWTLELLCTLNDNLSKQIILVLGGNKLEIGLIFSQRLYFASMEDILSMRIVHFR
jgi:hypothetical protein